MTIQLVALLRKGARQADSIQTLGSDNAGFESWLSYFLPVGTQACALMFLSVTFVIYEMGNYYASLMNGYCEAILLWDGISSMDSPTGTDNGL